MRALLLFMLVLVLMSCQKVDLREETTNCIERKIIEFKSDKSSCETGKQVHRYEFQGQHVYVFSPGNCGADMMANVYDEDCDLVCRLGGIAGNTNCNGEEFSTNATDETLIWEN